MSFVQGVLSRRASRLKGATNPITHTNLMPLHIESRILTVRGVTVIIDADRAELYGVPRL